MHHKHTHTSEQASKQHYTAECSYNMSNEAYHNPDRMLNGDGHIDFYECFVCACDMPHSFNYNFPLNTNMHTYQFVCILT